MKNMVINLDKHETSVINTSGCTEETKQNGTTSCIDWIVDGLIQEGGFNVVAVPEGTDNYLPYLLAHDIHTGLEFVGNETKESNVLYVDFEMEPESIERRTQILSSRCGIDEAPVVVSLYNKDHSVSDVINEVKKALAENPDVEVIVYDNFESMITRTENHGVEALIEDLEDLHNVSDTATTVMVCHNDNTLDYGKDGLFDKIATEYVNINLI